MLSEMTTTMDVTGSAATALLDNEIRGVRFGPAATTSAIPASTMSTAAVSATAAAVSAATTSAASGALSLSDSSASRLVAPTPSPQTSTSEESEAQDVCRGCGVVASKEILTEQVLDRRARRRPSLPTISIVDLYAMMSGMPDARPLEAAEVIIWSYRLGKGSTGRLRQRLAAVVYARRATRRELRDMLPVGDLEGTTAIAAIQRISLLGAREEDDGAALPPCE